MRKRVVERPGRRKRGGGVGGGDWGLTYVWCTSNKPKVIVRYACVSLCGMLLFSRGLKGYLSIASSITTILITFRTIKPINCCLTISTYLVLLYNVDHLSS